MDKRVYIFFTLFIITIISHSQEKCDFDSFIKNEFPAKEKKLWRGN